MHDVCFTVGTFLAVKGKQGCFHRLVDSNIRHSSRDGYYIQRQNAYEHLAFSRTGNELTLWDNWTDDLGRKRHYVTRFARLDI